MKFVIATTLAILFCVGTAFSAVDTKGLVMFLPFDEGTGTVAKDTSGNGNNGTLTGKVEWVTGKYKKAVRILDSDPGNFVSVKANKTLDVTDQMSFGGWLYIETVLDGSCSLMTKANAYMFHMSDWSGKGYEMEPLLWPFDAWQTPISAPIQLKEWHHVMGTFDGKNLSNYIDGKLIASRAFASKIDVTAGDLVIGRDSRDCCIPRRTTVIVDDAILFNRGISAGEVTDVMAGNLTAVTPKDRVTTLWGQLKSE